MASTRLALGLSVHTGRATCCVVGGDVHAPLVVARDVVQMMGDPERFVFHRAAELSSGEARVAVEEARRRALLATKHALATIVDRARAQGTIVAAAVVAKSGAIPPLEKIVASHPRIHSSEGLFYRDVLRDALRACGVEATIVAPKELEPSVATTKLLSSLGRTLGPPWTKDEKTASLAGWRLLGIIAPQS